MTNPRGEIGGDPMRPVYPFEAVGAPIELYSSDISVGGTDPRPGRVFVDMSGDLKVRWQLAESAWGFEIGAVELGLARPDLGWTILPAQNYSGSGSGLIGDATLGVAGAMCDHVIVHLTTLLSIFPYGSGRLQLSGAGWELVLEGRPDHAER
jgi:hypothetical protein